MESFAVRPPNPHFKNIASLTYFAGAPGQTISGGNGNILTGGNGPDQFVFKGDFGRNEITDFRRPDTLQLDKSTFGTVQDILKHYASDDGHGNTVIVDPHNAANTIILDHVGPNQLRASDFVLV